MIPTREIGECTRCGCCAVVCPQGCITLDEYPVVGEGCTECGLCTTVCPGQGIPLKKWGETLFEKAHYNTYVGRFIQTYTGYSHSDQIREKATSGGFVTSFLVWLLKEGIIDGALVVSFADNPWKTRYVVATTEEDIIKSAQTKYQITSLNPVTVDLEKIAVVGLPCVIHGLRKIQESTNIGLLLGLFCWVNMEEEATEFLLKKLNIRKDQIKSIEYRSGDYLGGFKVVLKDGTIKFLEKECYNVLPLLFAPERCVYCPDFTNELADISVGDAKGLQSEKGHTYIVTRSERGETLVNTCTEKGYIHIERCTLEEIIQSESSSLLFKKGSYQRMDTFCYGKEEYSIPLKNKVFAFVFKIVHNNREFFKKLFLVMPLPVFKIVSQLITSERS